MPEAVARHLRVYRRTALSAASLAFGLIVLGGVVRISGSGLGCGDHWPLCNGQWFPPLDLPTLIEIGHRWVAALLSATVIGLAVVAWRQQRGNPELRGPATVALILLVIQVLLGPVIVKLDLPPGVIVVHLLNAMVLLSVLVIAALRASDQLKQTARISAGIAGRPLIHATATLGFVVILFGGMVANLNAGLVCQGFPLCQGQLGPPLSTLGIIHWTHRILAFSFLALVVTVLVRVSRRREEAARPLRRAAWMTLVATLAQIGIAASMVLHLLPAPLRALHLLAGTAVWASLVVLVYRAGRTPAEGVEMATAAPNLDARPSLLADLVTLTKPRIISLLLVTTVAPMFITGRGVPSFSLVMWVIVAGYLMAGGANTINMWFDRDIDDKMSRTRLRPIPSGRMSPASVLTFGILLAAIAFALFYYLINPLSAWLALGGLLFYVFVYTVWLKRITPQNIVIGGAAGAFPPLVGWAAMTGGLDLAAVYLFAIIFYWTPPHFWALALIKQGEYSKAGIPMMPCVRGDHGTKLQMLAYTIMLLPLTIAPSFFGALGVFYGVAAALLGARLLWYCVRLLKESGVTPTAWKMYKYSLLYLALLFVAMGIDRALPFGHGFERREVLILQHPDQEAMREMPGMPGMVH
ncbi:MAG: heme o synthase [Gemmatimonadota bacterium]